MSAVRSAEVTCAGCAKEGAWPTVCPICLSKKGQTVPFCSSTCFQASYTAHKKEYHTKSAPRCVAPSAARGPQLLDLGKDTYDLFVHEGVKVKLHTPRLLLRPVRIEDEPRILKIKSEPAVNAHQLYGHPPSRQSVRDFAQGYVANNVAAVYSHSSPNFSRMRYVFGIEIARDEEGQPQAVGKAGPYKDRLSEDGYMGNLAIEVECPKASTISSKACERFLYGPVRGEPFRYPTTAQMAKWNVTGILFYELWPSLHRQGLMSEAVEAALRYSFDVLRLVSVMIDPRTTNEASKRIARKYGGVHKETIRRNAWLEGWIEQEIWIITREAWYEGEKSREGGTKQEPRDALVDGCRWCQRADSTGTLSCTSCDWARYCSVECREADLSFSGRGPVMPTQILPRWGGPHTTQCTRDALPLLL